MEPRSSLFHRAFAEHPRSLGVGYLTHMRGAMSIGASLVTAGAACFVHALVPGVLTNRASRTIDRLHGHIKARNRGSSEHNWLDYEI